MGQTNKHRAAQGTTTTTETTYPGGLITQAYNNTQCFKVLGACGTFLHGHKDGIAAAEVMLVKQLLKAKSETPKDSVFEDHTFDYICTRMAERNETAVIQLIHRLIIPFAEIAVHRGQVSFKHLINSINEQWDGCNSLEEPVQLMNSRALQNGLPRPQPDYAVGFTITAFNAEQKRKLQPHLGGLNDTSFFKGTLGMLFPFLIAEAKSCTGTLESADRASSHSTTIAMRGVVHLYTAAKRAKELHRKVLAFSITHDHRSVRIYAHYPIIMGGATTYYRHLLADFCFVVDDGEKRWIAYHFVMAVYNSWAPSHFRLLCSAIDDLPELDFDSASSLPGSGNAGEDGPQAEAEEAGAGTPDPANNGI
ncbi:hypothetical protein BJY00DRAFT_310230 [Aspergillus carlsbadensis]|nr:hypothetical protein BJY00DRAFT_310230 [Aspergillus carlsbadensis]